MKTKKIVFSLTVAICLSAMLGCYQSKTVQLPETKPTETTEAQVLQSGLAEQIRIAGQEVDFQTLTQRLAHYHVPGVSVAFVRNGKLAWTLHSGVKDLTSGLPIDAATVFQAGSISKPAFASVLMKYRQHNSLDLDEDVNKLLTSWQLPQHEWSGQQVVSLRRLLSHTAGTTVHGFPGYAAGETVPTLQQVLDGVAPANTGPVIVDIQPGSRMRYSGGGTTLAQLTLQDVSGEHLPAMAERLLFGPLDMTRSSFNQPIAPALANNMAIPYDGDGAPVKGGAHTYATLAAAGMWSTPSDMLKMASAVRSAYFGEKIDWLSQETAVEILTTNAPTARSPNVGMGFFLNMTDEGKILGFGHGGADEGFKSQLYLELESGNGYAIMTNGNNGNQLITELEIRIKEALGVGYVQPEIKTIINISQEDLNEYIATYHVSAAFEVDVVLETAENGFLLTASPYVENAMHWHQGEGTFFAKDGSRISFERDESGAITTLVMSNGLRGSRKK